MTDRPVESTCATTQLVSTTVTVTVTSTVHATPSRSMTPVISPSCSVSTVSVTPSTVQCSDQQIAENDDNSCNAVAICIPVAVVIAVIACVVVIVVVWRFRQKSNYNLTTSHPEMAKVYNDIYGSVGCMHTQMYGKLAVFMF